MMPVGGVLFFTNYFSAHELKLLYFKHSQLWHQLSSVVIQFLEWTSKTILGYEKILPDSSSFYSRQGISYLHFFPSSVWQRRLWSDFDLWFMEIVVFNLVPKRSWCISLTFVLCTICNIGLAVLSLPVFDYGTLMYMSLYLTVGHNVYVIDF